MSKSQNKIQKNNKFYNFQYGKQPDGFLFVLPTITISPKKMLHWDLEMYSIFFSWGKHYIQFNFFTIIKDTNTEVFRENMTNLINFLKANNLGINEIQNALDYLNKNPFLVTLIKNSDLKHPYIKTILLSYLNNTNFIISTK